MKRWLTIAMLMLCVLLIAASRAGLVLPWSRMTTLTPEQQAKIVTIHRRALDEMHQVKEREQSDIWAILGDPQRNEYRAMKGGRSFVPPLPSTQPAATQPATTQPTTLPAPKP